MVARKNKRRIVVNNKEYWWQVHYDRDGARPYLYSSPHRDKLLLKQACDKECILSGAAVKQLILDNRL